MLGGSAKRECPVLVKPGPRGIFAGIMRTTSSFEIFPDEPSERELARARWLRREGRIAEAEAAYRGVMERQPGLRSSWTECFDLLRSAGQLSKALSLALEAEGVFSTEAFPLALKGAALIEQDRIPDAIEVLEVAVERDPNLALTWHELGYAAYRLGNGDRALLALDRAFALEPHTETLVLRGRIFRDASAGGGLAGNRFHPPSWSVRPQAPAPADVRRALVRANRRRHHCIAQRRGRSDGRRFAGSIHQSGNGLRLAVRTDSDRRRRLDMDRS